MKKKIDLFWYWFIFVVAFVLCFFCVNNKKINAYYLNEEGNLQSYNLVDFSNYRHNIGEFNSNVTQYNDPTSQTLTISTTTNNTNNSYGVIIYNLFDTISLNNDNYYSFSFYISTPLSNNYYSIGFEHYDGNSLCPGLIENVESGVFYYTFKGSCINNYNYPFIVYYRTIDFSDNRSTFYIFDEMLYEGEEILPYEPFGVWYSESNAEDMFLGRLPNFTSSLTYTNQDNGVTSTINDVNSYIDNSFGYLYFDRLWNYLDSLTSSSYDNAKLTIIFNDNLNINTSYIINSNKENYGSGVWFYQNNDLMLDVRNFLDNEYCSGSSQYSCNVELNKYVNVGSGVNSFSYLNKIVVWSSSTTERTLAFGYNNIGYNTGYDNGYNVGYKDGKKVADDLIYNNGYTNGYNLGYDAGVNYASGGGNTLVGLVGSIFTAPVNMLHTIFDFEFLGINLTNFLFSLISLFIVIWLIKKFL